MPNRGPIGKFALHIPKKQFAKQLGDQIVRSIRRRSDVDPATRDLLSSVITELSEGWERNLLQDFLAVERIITGIVPATVVPITVDAGGNGNFKGLQEAIDYTATFTVPANGIVFYIIVGPNGHNDPGTTLSFAFTASTTKHYISGPVRPEGITGTGDVTFLDARIVTSGQVGAFADTTFTGKLTFDNTFYSGDNVAGVVSGSNVTINIINGSLVGTLGGVAGGALNGIVDNSQVQTLWTGSSWVHGEFAASSSVILSLSGGSTITGGASGTRLEFRDCHIGLSGGTTTIQATTSTQIAFDGNVFDTSGSASFNIGNLGANTSLTFNNNRRVVKQNGLITLTITAVAAADISCQGNNMEACRVIFTGSSTGHVNCSGLYASIKNDIWGSNFNVLCNPANGAVIAFEQTGDFCTIVGVIVGAASVGITLSGNNNFALINNLATATTPSSVTGSGNFLNAFPPTGAAGGDLDGTYPNPRVRPNFARDFMFSVPGTLKTTGVVPGSYGDSTHYVTLALDSRGRVTSAASVLLPTATVSLIQDFLLGGM